MSLSRRRLLGLLASFAAAPAGVAAAATEHARGGLRLDRRVCGLDIHPAAIFDAEAWDAAFEARWGPLGAFSPAQLRDIAFGGRDIYDDSDARFAFVVHYWVRAFVVMADLTGAARYMDAAASLIDTMLANTDARRVERGEIREAYVRDPGYFRGTGRGGPFWKRGEEANVLDTGQIANAILRFVDLVLTQPQRFAAWQSRAERYFEEAVVAVDIFDNDWQIRDRRTDGPTGAYHYRDSGGSGDLGVTPTAFNQSATMMVAQLLIDRHAPSAARKEKVDRLVRYWLASYRRPNGDGTVLWPYIVHPQMTTVEDTDHGASDVDFLTAAWSAGLGDLERRHMDELAKTFLARVFDPDRSLNAFIDGSTRRGYDEHWNAGLGWFELAAVDRRVAQAALAVFEAHYPPDSAPGVLWARPMLGWAKLVYAARPCR